MMIDKLGFKTLREWLEIFPPKTELVIKNFGRTYCLGKQDSLLKNLPPVLLKSYVCNMDDFVSELILDTACYELDCDNKKDEIFTDIWMNVYVATNNSELMKELFEEYKTKYEQR